MEKEVISKKKVINILLKSFFGTILFAVILAMIFTNGKAFSGEDGKIVLKAMLIAAGFILIIFIVVGWASYSFHNKHPELYNKLNSPKGKKNTSIFVILFGIYLILQGVYSHFIMNPPTELKFSLIYVGFGIFTIIWGLYYLRKNKSKN
jgi:hypothetical protein